MTGEPTPAAYRAAAAVALQALERIAHEDAETAQAAAIADQRFDA